MCYHFHFWGMSYLTQYVDHTTIGGISLECIIRPRYANVRVQYLVQGSHTLEQHLNAECAL